ncbi:MAG: hypothetical protein AAGI01_05805 [Myxococcota bacterium]
MSRLSPRVALACALLLVASMAFACEPPSDPVLSGRLCAPGRPAERCDSSVVVLRNTTDGRNALDFRLINQGASEATLRVLSGVAATQSTPTDLDMDDAGDDGTDPTAPSVSPCTPACEELEVTLAPGASTLNRFTPMQLGRRQELFLGVVCVSGSCDATLEYVLVVEPLECNENSDCSSGWLCDIEAGQCLECIGDDDEGQCAEGQSCQLGRCLPPQSTCSSAPGPTTPEAPVLLLGIAGVACIIRRRRLRSLSAGFAVMLGTSLVATAQEPSSSPNPTPSAAPAPLSTHFTAGVSTAFFLGEAGALTGAGYGLNVSEELQWRNLGAGASFTAGFFVTDVGEQAVLPLSRTLQTYSFQLGPRIFFPVSRPIELYARLDYERLGLASNSLFELTGPQVGYNAVHGAFGALLTSFAPVEVRLHGAYHYIFGFPGSMISVVLSVGLVGP